MAKKKAFPNQVYVFRMNEGTSDEYLAVETDVDSVAKATEKDKTLVGVYELSELGHVAPVPATYDRTSR